MKKMKMLNKNEIIKKQISLILRELFCARKLDEVTKFGKSHHRSLWQIGSAVFKILRKHKLKNALDEWYRRRIKRDYRILKPWIIGKKVLDYGSGRGHLGLKIAQGTGKSVTLADIEDRNTTSLPFFIINEAGSLFKNNQFDTTILVNVLHHTKNAEEVIKEAGRVSKRRVIIFEHHLYNSQRNHGLTRKDWEFLFYLSEEIFYFSGKNKRPRLNFQSYPCIKRMFKRHHLNLVYEKYIPFPNKNIFILDGYLFILKKLKQPNQS